jgi:hypothetical protein
LRQRCYNSIRIINLLTESVEAQAMEYRRLPNDEDTTEILYQNMKISLEERRTEALLTQDRLKAAKTTGLYTSAELLEIWHIFISYEYKIRTPTRGMLRDACTYLKDEIELREVLHSYLDDEECTKAFTKLNKQTEKKGLKEAIHIQNRALSSYKKAARDRLAKPIYLGYAPFDVT